MNGIDLKKRCEQLILCDTNGIFSKARLTCEKFNMLDMLKGGTVVGLSGGADSVLLLIFLCKLSRDLNFKLKAVHVNHHIRGEEADRDEEFSQQLCNALEIPFKAIHVDVPALAEKTHSGLEECARNVRYTEFERIRLDSGFSAIAVAHNASDNAETVIFNLARGTGIKGLCGIPKIRERIVRPLIEISKKNIFDALSENGIPFVTDSTNESSDYTRNYIRRDILPRFSRINPEYEKAIGKTGVILLRDEDFLRKAADDATKNCLKGGAYDASMLKELHPAILSRVILNIITEKSSVAPEQIHVESIMDLIMRGNNFAIDIPGNLRFISQSGRCTVKYKNEAEENISFTPVFLHEGFNEIPELDMGIFVSHDKNEVFSSNVYKISIQAEIDSAIIKGRIFVRTRNDGDKYRFGGMTHKVKRLFSDKKIPQSERDRIPIICDDDGILYIPGFPLREGGVRHPKDTLSLSIYKKGLDILDEG